MKNSKWTISAKLWILSGGMLFNLILVGGFAYWNSFKMAKQLRELGEVQLPAVRQMTLADMMHDGIRAEVFRAIVSSGTADEKQIEQVRKDSEETQKNILEYIHALEKLDIHPDTRKAIAPAIPEINTYVESAKKVVAVALSGKTEQAIALLPEFEERFESLEKSLGQLGELIEADAKEAEGRGHELAQRAGKINLTAILFGLFIGIAAAAWIIRELQKSLKQVIASLSHESQVVTKSARTLSSAAQQLSAATSQQASALQETASSVDEITAMVKKTSENSKQLESSAQESQQSASQGQRAITDMLNSMETIREANAKVMAQVEHGNQQITEIVQVISEIGNKTKVINDIVFQTKLLSFNASVEAARAGEHGKGFAVVAEEVGNLAQMSGNAAKEISDMLSSSIQKVEGIVVESKSKVETLIADSKSKLDSGTSVAHQCGDALSEIVKQASGVSAMISEITTAIQEQNQGIQEISKAVQQLDQSTNENAATSKETSQTSDSLLTQAQTLKDIVDSLKRMVVSEGAQVIPIQPIMTTVETQTHFEDESPQSKAS